VTSGLIANRADDTNDERSKFDVRLAFLRSPTVNLSSKCERLPIG
jgi:hypothetical protein